MELRQALDALGALSQETRLTLFRHLVTAGPAGESPGALATRFDLPPATLSFHLKALADAGLIHGTRAGRSIRYAADYPAMDALLAYLTEHCCAGDPGACTQSPLPSPARRRRERSRAGSARLAPPLKEPSR
jgi:DNA-binding transcriptional ArsR family regulator